LKGVVQAVNSNEPIDGEAGDKQGWRKSMSIETRGRTDLMIIGDYLEISSCIALQTMITQVHTCGVSGSIWCLSLPPTLARRS
jgi:hypothetical protein